MTLPTIHVNGQEIRTLSQWREFSRRDDCLSFLVPSDLRLLLGLIPRPIDLEGKSEDKLLLDQLKITSGILRRQGFEAHADIMIKAAERIENAS